MLKQFIMLTFSLIQQCGSGSTIFDKCGSGHSSGSGRHTDKAVQRNSIAVEKYFQEQGAALEFSNIKIKFLV